MTCLSHLHLLLLVFRLGIELGLHVCVAILSAHLSSQSINQIDILVMLSTRRQDLLGMMHEHGLSLSFEEEGRAAARMLLKQAPGLKLRNISVSRMQAWRSRISQASIMLKRTNRLHVHVFKE